MHRLTFLLGLILPLAFVATAGAVQPTTTATSSIPNGTYRTSFTDDQLRGPGIGPKQRSGSVGVYTLKISSGSWKMIVKSPTPGASGVLTGTYSGSGHRVGFLHKTPREVAGVSLQLVWSLDGKALRFKAAPGSGFPAPVVKVIWTRHPWLRTA